MTASGTALGGPTSIVAVLVLAVGLLAFLTIQPIEPTSSMVDPSLAIASPPEVDAAGLAAGESSQNGSSTTAPAEAEAASGAGAESDAPVAASASPLDSADGETQGNAAAPAPGDGGHFPPSEIAAASSVAGSIAPPLVDAPQQRSLDSSVPPSVDPSEPPSVDASGAAHEPVEAATEPHRGESTLQQASSPELMTPAASAAAPLALRTARALADPLQAHDHDGPEARPNARVRTQAAPMHGGAPVSSKRQAADSEPSRGARESARPQRPGSWLGRLRAELSACEGNLIVRTVCEETAKMRYCSSANAWGEVSECPAARLPDLATFN